ncbi:MAG: hypothetical protein AB7E72_04185 [Lysobacterales bacterium]
MLIDAVSQLLCFFKPDISFLIEGGALEVNADTIDRCGFRTEPYAAADRCGFQPSPSISGHRVADVGKRFVSHGDQYF